MWEPVFYLQSDSDISEILLPCMLVHLRDSSRKEWINNNLKVRRRRSNVDRSSHCLKGSLQDLAAVGLLWEFSLTLVLATVYEAGSTVFIPAVWKLSHEQYQRPEPWMVTFTTHMVCKYKVHKLHQRYNLCTLYLHACQVRAFVWHLSSA